MRAVDAIMECLKAEGVDAVFGIPGGANLPTYDALYDAGIRNILCRHEQGAGHAAEGYAKASGKVGVALAHLRPRRDQPRHGDRRRDARLGADRLHHGPGANRPDGHRRLPGGRHDRDHDARRQALLPGARPARDPAHDPRGLPRRPHRAAGPGAGRRPAGPVARRHPVRPLRGARRSTFPATRTSSRATPSRSASPRRRSRTPSGPIIYAGGGVINGNAAEELTELVVTGGFPITCTVMGLGGFPAPHDQWLGMLGMHGTRTANYAMDNADLIVAVGARFDDRITGKLVRVRAAREVRPHRHRPGRDLQERAGAHPDRRRLQADPAEADGRVPRARGRPRRAWTSGGRSCASGRTSTR